MCAKIPCKDHTPEQRKAVEDFEKLIGRKLAQPTVNESSNLSDSTPYCCVACGNVFMGSWGICSSCIKLGR